MFKVLKLYLASEDGPRFCVCRHDQSVPDFKKTMKQVFFRQNDILIIYNMTQEICILDQGLMKDWVQPGDSIAIGETDNKTWH